LPGLPWPVPPPTNTGIYGDKSFRGLRFQLGGRNPASRNLLASTHVDCSLGPGRDIQGLERGRYWTSRSALPRASIGVRNISSELTLPANRVCAAVTARAPTRRT